MNNKQAEPLKTGVAELKRLDALPSPQFSDFHKASKEELVDHIVELRLWCGQVVMALKDVTWNEAEFREVQNMVGAIYSALNADGALSEKEEEKETTNESK